MRTLTSRDAWEIQKKLDGEIKEGRKHPQVIVRWEGKVVGRYGVRRGSGETGHDYIPEQLSISFRQALDLVRCPLTKEGYFEILRAKGKLS